MSKQAQQRPVDSQVRTSSLWLTFQTGVNLWSQPSVSLPTPAVYSFTSVLPLPPALRICNAARMSSPHGVFCARPAFYLCKSTLDLQAPIKRVRSKAERIMTCRQL